MATTPEAIFATLKTIAPDIKFSVIWEEDRYFKWDGDGPDPLLEGYIPHDVDVFATAVVQGETLSGRGSLGGVYDKPDERDRDIHGYLPQKIEEAVDELLEEIPKRNAKLVKQLTRAKKYLKEVMHLRYEDGQRPGYQGGVMDWYPGRRPELGIDFPRKKFSSPQIMITPGAEKALIGDIPADYLDRHFMGDWGDVGAEDKAQNNDMIAEKGMILSSYVTKGGTKIWIITDPGHEISTILLPEEY